MNGSPREALLAGLNPRQQEAVRHTEGPLFVLAGAGSGKTRVITHRIAWILASGCPPDGVLAITFTNKAAAEMRERTRRLCGLETPWISTFHSLAARLLRRHAYRIEPYDTSFTICDRDDCRAIVKEILKAQQIDSRLWEPGGVLSEISRRKSAADSDEPEFGSDYRYGQILRNIYHAYVEHMERSNLLDFDDLLLLLVRLLEEHPDVLDRYRTQFRYVLVDEYQDTNAIQYRITKLLSAEHRNLCITGDPDQSIYAWRGADITNILHFERDYPGATVVKLEQNYRSTANVLRVANTLIAHNVDRKPKDLWTENPDGEPVRVYRFDSELDEARDVAALVRGFLDSGVPCGDIAVFYRLNALSRAIEQELIFANVPYSIVGGLEFFLRKEIKDLIAYLRLIDNPRDSESLKRVINVPTRGIGKTTLDRLQTLAREQRRGLLEVVLAPDLRDGLRGRAAKAIDGFRELYERIAAHKQGPMEDLLRGVIEETGFEEHLRAQHGEEAEERIANIGELVNAAAEHDKVHPPGSLTEFLELTALLGDVDRWEQREDRVSLMTLHSAKGLEFPVVIIVGVEDGVLPLIRSGDGEPDFEEERRLLYVGITRAREKLYLTHAASRLRYGQVNYAFPSRFLQELVPTSPDAREAFRQLEMDLETEESLQRREARQRAWDATSDDGFDRYFESEAPRERSLRRSVAEPESFDDPGFELDEDPFPDGVRVLHDEYGEGEVLRSAGFGARRRVTVRFEEAGEKQFVVQYAPLRRIR